MSSTEVLARRFVTTLAATASVVGLGAALAASASDCSSDTFSGADATTADGSAAGDAATDAALADASSGEVAMAPSAYVTAVLADAPLAYWRLGEPRAAVAFDLVGHHDGAYAANVAVGQPGAIHGDPDTAIAVDGGSGERIDFGDIFPFLGNAAFSVECWVDLPPDYATSGAGVYRRVVTKEGLDTGGATQGWVISVHGADGVLLERFRDGGAQAVSAPLDGGVYHHVVATYDGASLALFVDGVRIDTGPATDPLVDPGSPLLIAGSVFDPEASLIGAIDEVAVYDHALTIERINAHYDAAVSGR